MPTSIHTPVIIIPGFGQSKAALYDKDGSFEKQAWPLKFDVAEMAKKITKPYLKTVAARKDMGFTDTAYKMYCEQFEPFSCNADGSLKHNLKAIENTEALSELPEKIRNYVHKLVPVDMLSEKIGNENLFFFAYNAFSSPYETAQKLSDFVEHVKSLCNAEKVSFLAFSMGGAVMTAYFDLYKEKNDTEKVFFLNCALGGSILLTDIMENNVNKKEGYSLLGFISNPDTVKTFKKALAFTPWDVRYALLFRSLDAVRDVVFLNSPGMWALMPPDQYDRLEEKYISDENHKNLRETNRRFFKAQNNFSDTLKELKDSGVEIYICAGYGLHLMPLSASQDISTDGMLPVKSTSLGEEVKFGEKPDKEKLLLPENTYLFEGLTHSGGVKDERIQKLVAEKLG